VDWFFWFIGAKLGKYELALNSIPPERKENTGRRSGFAGGNENTRFPIKFELL